MCPYSQKNVTNTSALLSIPKSASASKAPASATIQVTNTSPAAKEERESPSTADSAISEPSEAESMMERMQAAQEAQTKTNDVTLSAMHGIVNAILKINNASKVDISFERLTTKLLLEQKYTNFPTILESRTQESLSI